MRLQTATLAAVVLTVVGAAAQTSTTQIPRNADGHPNLQGFWKVSGSRAADNLEAVVEGGTIPYLPAAATQRTTNFANRATADPLSKCYMPGVPRVMYAGSPFQILQAREHIAMLFEWMLDYRLIYTNGAPHETRVNPWMGDSRGHWEGDTLVVDVTNHSELPWLDKAGNFHSDALKVVERYAMADANTILYTATLEDPKTFSRPWTIAVSLVRQQNVDRLRESHCQADKEEASGEFEREARTWYPGANAPRAAMAFTPPAEQHRPSTVTASIRRTADGKPDLNGLYEADGGGANYGLEAHPPSPGALTPPGRGVLVDPEPDGNPPFQPWARAEIGRAHV